MTPMEIALLVIGVIIFVLSFLLPDKGDKKSEKQIQKEEEEVRRMMEQELDGMKYRVNEATNDSIDYAVDRVERSLERISNEKIMAVNEYGQTIIEDINKNHQEVMFLYDMLKDKHTDLTNSVREADATAKKIEKLSKTAKSATWGLESELNVISATKKGLTEEQKSVFDEVDSISTSDFTPIANQVDTITVNNNSYSENAVTAAMPNMEADMSEPVHHETVVMDIMSGTKYKPDNDSGVMTPVFGAEVKTSENSKPDSMNSNQRILELHSQGMATVDIAKELKLGVGEVKLVIDLYQ